NYLNAVSRFGVVRQSIATGRPLAISDSDLGAFCSVVLARPSRAAKPCNTPRIDYRMLMLAVASLINLILYTRSILNKYPCYEDAVYQGRVRMAIRRSPHPPDHQHHSATTMPRKRSTIMAGINSRM